MAQAGFALRAIVPTTKVVSVGWACSLLVETADRRRLAPLLSRLADSRPGRLKPDYRFGDLVTVVATADTPDATNRQPTVAKRAHRR